MQQEFNIIIEKIDSRIREYTALFETGKLTSSDFQAKKDDLNHLNKSVQHAMTLALSNNLAGAVAFITNQKFPDEIKDKLLATINFNKQEKINFFYLDSFNEKIKLIDPGLSWKETCLEIIEVYKYFIAYYQQAPAQSYKLGIDVNKKFSNKIDALNGLKSLETTNQEVLINYLAKDNFEPIVVDLLSSKLPKVLHTFLRQIPLEHLYIPVAKFPYGANTDELEYKLKVKKDYTPDNNDSFTFEQSKSSSIFADPVISAPQVIEVKEVELPVIKQAITIPESPEKVEKPSQLEKVLPIMDLTIINDLTKKVAQLPEQFTQLILSLEKKLSEKEVTVYSPEADSALELLNTFINDQSSAEDDLSEDFIANEISALSENVYAIREQIKTLSVNSDKFGSAIDLLDNFSKTLIDQIIKIVTNSLDPTKLGSTIVNINKANYELITASIENFLNSIKDDLAVNLKAVDDFVNVNSKNNKAHFDQFKSTITEISESIRTNITEFNTKVDTLKAFLNDYVVGNLNQANTGITDLNRNIKINNNLLEKKKFNNSSLLITMFLALNFAIGLVLVYGVYTRGGSSDNSAIELRRILTNVKNLDSRNKSAVMQVLQISDDELK